MCSVTIFCRNLINRLDKPEPGDYTYMYLNDQTEEGACSYLLLLTDETLWGVLSQVSEFL